MRKLALISAIALSVALAGCDKPAGDDRGCQPNCGPHSEAPTEAAVATDGAGTQGCQSNCGPHSEAPTEAAAAPERADTKGCQPNCGPHVPPAPGSAPKSNKE